MEDVLVLNANFEPINTCTMERAVGMMVTQKASMVLNGRGEIRTACDTFPRPSVIRLQKMVHRPRVQVKLTRREILRRDFFTCQYCGKHEGLLTIDHVIPRHLGGPHTWWNVVTACAPCNHKKGGRRLSEASMVLLRTPKEPPATARYLFGRYLSVYMDWEPFIQGW